MIIITTLVIPPGGDAGPFDLYSNVDGYTVPFATGISALQLEAGYSSTVPDNATSIKVVSVGICTNFIILDIDLIPTTTTTSSSSTSTSTSTSTSSTTTSTTTPVPTTTTTTTQVYTNAGTIVNNTANTITANTAFVKVNGGMVAAITNLNIAPGGTLTFDTTYSSSSYVTGAGNYFTLELYTYTGVTTSNDMNQGGGDCVTTVGGFANMGTYLSATSTTTGPSVCSVFVIAMTIT